MLRIIFCRLKHLCNCGSPEKKKKLQAVGSFTSARAAILKTLKRPVEQVLPLQSDQKYGLSLIHRLGHKTLGARTKWSIVISAMCRWLVYSNETLAVLPLTRWLYGASPPPPHLKEQSPSSIWGAPPRPVLPQIGGMDFTHTPSYKVTVKLPVCLFSMSLKPPPTFFRCIPSIYHVNTLFIEPIYLFIYWPYFLCIYWRPDYLFTVTYLFIIFSKKMNIHWPCKMLLIFKENV